MENGICAFSGHRSLPANELAAIAFSLRKEVVRQTEGGVYDFGCGGARGFDTLAALTVLELAEADPRIRLILVLPCEDQDKGWPAHDRERYRRIKERAHETVILHEKYVYGCMQERNRLLIDRAGLLVAYLTQPRGGTY